MSSPTAKPHDSKSDTDLIHITLAHWSLTDDYNRHCGVVISSLLENASRPVVVHLLYGEKLSEENKKDAEYNLTNYQKIADKYNTKIYYHLVDFPTHTPDADAIKTYSFGTLLRLFIPEIFPDFDKIIYLDCDMVVLTDIAKLWDLELGDSYLSARPDLIQPGNKQREKYYRKKGISVQNYFNAGLLVLNLKKIREAGLSLSKNGLVFLKENPDLPYLDQDILNKFCQDNYLRLDARYNVYSVRENPGDFNNDCIIHYIGPKDKPWKQYNNSCDEYYWHYLLQTPWCTTENEIRKYMRAAPDTRTAMNLLEDDFFLYVNGNDSQKFKYAMQFVLKILKSGMHSLIHRNSRWRG